MSTWNLKYLLAPKSIAFVGATERPGSVGAVITRNLMAADFDGEVMPVNPHYEEIAGLTCYKDVSKLPSVPDAAIIATPLRTVADIVDKLGRMGTRAAAVITSGFEYTPGRSASKQAAAVRDAARKHGLRLIGPNSLGLMLPHLRLNASLSKVQPLPGEIAFIARSGEIASSLIDWATPREIGFSVVATLGDMMDVDYGDLFDYLIQDRHTKSVLLYLEDLHEARKFMSAARALARVKPLVLIRAGRSHGAFEDALYDAAFARAGALRVENLEAMFHSVAVLPKAPRRPGDRLLVLTNGPSAAVIAEDAVLMGGARLAELSDKGVADLKRGLSYDVEPSNPLALKPNASAEEYAAALSVLVAEPDTDGVLVMHAPNGAVDPADVARVVAGHVDKTPHALLCSWLGSASLQESREVLAKYRLPAFGLPDDAVRAFMNMDRYRRSQISLMQTPAAHALEATESPQDINAWLTDIQRSGQRQLLPQQVFDLFGWYELPRPHIHHYENEEDVVSHAASQVAGARIAGLLPNGRNTAERAGVRNVDAALRTTESIRVTADRPLNGFVVGDDPESPVPPPIRLSLTESDVFGPVVEYGAAGEVGEVGEVNDSHACALPPLNDNLARDLMQRSRAHRRLMRWGVDVELVETRLVDMLIRLSQLIVEQEAISAIHIDPLWFVRDEPWIGGVRVMLRKRSQKRSPGLAIPPYPKHLEESLSFTDGREFRLRPIRPEDEVALQKAFERLTPEEIHLRFHHSIGRLSHQMASRLSQIDYDREMALVLADEAPAGKARIHAEARLVREMDRPRGQFAIIVGRHLARRGIGRLLLTRMADYALDLGLEELRGEILSDNEAMVGLATSMGFSFEPLADDPGVLMASLSLQAWAQRDKTDD